MFISPKTAYENGWVTGLINPEKQIGSDGIDLTLKALSTVDETQFSVLTESKVTTEHRAITKLSPQPLTLPNGAEVSGYHLDGGVYDIEFNEFVKIPKGVAAILLLRSSFVRAGHCMFSGLYDQGFENYAGAVLHLKGSTAIEHNMRVAQIVFVASEGSGSLYAGGYNYVAGDQNWQDAANRASENEALQ